MQRKEGVFLAKITAFSDVGGIGGLTVILPKLFSDDRGYLFESYNIDELKEIGITDSFIQDNEASSKKNVLRGFHVNVLHPQAKIIRVVKGKIYDAVIDLRKESKTFKKCYGIELSDANKKQLYIPERFGHAYFAIEDSIVSFKVTTHYIPNDEIGFAWNSEGIDVRWPSQCRHPIQNEKDRNCFDFNQIDWEEVFR